MKKITAKEMKNAVNDSGLSLREVNKALMDAVELEYGGVKMIVQRGALAQSHDFWNSQPDWQRRHIKKSVKRALDIGAKIILNEKSQASKLDCDNFMSDLVLWSVINKTN